MKQIDKLIICSPYSQPTEHWHRDPLTQEFDRVPGRRKAGYMVANPSKKSIETGQWIELNTVNAIRERLTKWQGDGRPGITGTTEELLNHWHDASRRKHPFFFCQLEAIETLIFMLEAPAAYTSGIDLSGDGGPFERLCSKMATGSGKTIVMSMIIAWNVLNKVNHPKDTRYSKNILVVAPGLTVKSRLQVLDPSDENNYFKEFGIVPSTLMDKLRQAKIKIINWHMLAWDNQDKLDKKKEKGFLRSVDKRRGMEISDLAYSKSVLGDMANAKNILVLNDEAHHAWRTAAESKVKQVNKEDIDNTVWVGGLDKLHNQVNILRCHDLSATPFAPTGKKTSEDALFSWIVSDFSLNDAIESGLVKTPRVVIRDDSKLDKNYKSRLYHIYNDSEVKTDLNQKDISEKAQLPQLLKNAYDLLGADWKKTKEEFKKSAYPFPPVMITVANRVETASRIRYHFESGQSEIKELQDPNKTLQIDSKVLGLMENEDSSLSGSKREQAEQLREKVDTVGKPGKPGEQIQNVISVGMLSEGWDANNVTQIMGLRAFSSQLLCEQVIGRGLRRVNYEFDENKMLAPEYVNIFGIPFQFLPHEGKGGGGRPPKPKYQIEPHAEKADKAIFFPNILRIETVYEPKLKLNWNELSVLEIDPEDVITSAELGGVVNGNVTPAALSEVNLKKLAEDFRLQHVVFKVASQVHAQEVQSWKGDNASFFQQLLNLTEQFIQSDKIHITSNLFSQNEEKKKILISLNISRIIRHFKQAIRAQNTQKLTPVFDKEKPIRSTFDMGTWYTTKNHEWHNKSHINLTVFDSTWEANNAHILEKHPSVKSFAKNDHLGFEIKYNFKGVVKNYWPDYLIELTNGDKLVLEVKGVDSDENRTKRFYLDQWIKAVNENGEFGNWHWAVVFNSSQIHDILERYREFPVAPFLPQSENETAENLETHKTELYSFLSLDSAALQKASSKEEMVRIAMRQVFEKNLEEIFEAVSKVDSKAAEGLDVDGFQEMVYKNLDSIIPTDLETYKTKVRNWLRLAKHLEKASFDYLVSAEYLNDSIVRQDLEDFSPFVLQFSRSVENELLQKVFVRFTNYINGEETNLMQLYSDDLRNRPTALFAKLVTQNRKNYTLGNMAAILELMQDNYLYEKSQLLQDFRDYLRDEDLLDLTKADFTKDLRHLLNKYRNQAAHSNTLTRHEASLCKGHVRQVLNKILINWEITEKVESDDL